MRNDQIRRENKCRTKRTGTKIRHGKEHENQKQEQKTYRRQTRKK